MRVLDVSYEHRRCIPQSSACDLPRVHTAALHLSSHLQSITAKICFPLRPMQLRRKEVPWEVVGSRTVEPVSMYVEDAEGLQILRSSDVNMGCKFVHDIRSSEDLRTAIYSARHQLMLSILTQQYNALLSEGWRITIMRNGRKHRVEVTYIGRPAFVAGKQRGRPPPPFLSVLDYYQQELLGNSL